MTQKALRDALESMAAMPGLEGCALVEIEAGGGGLPPVPPGVAGAPGASFGAGVDNAPPSSPTARRPAPSSQASTSPAKIIGWILFALLFIVIRALNG